LLPTAAGIIDEEKKVRHSKLADKIEEVISEPAKMEIKLKVGKGDGCVGVDVSAFKGMRWCVCDRQAGQGGWRAHVGVGA